MIYNAERPNNFDQIVGQELVVENIRNQSIKDSFFNVFVLCGQYGSGKTTMARIIAMAANCKHKDEKGNPCGKCDSCTAVLEHSPEGIVEIDGASNNGVDNIRKLLSQASTLGVFDKKVFVIDEAHMLSKAAFNALLITLEDPPEHCIFILCTTEKDALPETVVSRAPVYTFGKIPDVLIKDHILEVASKHGISITFDAAGLLSRYVNGAMRNALQLLEQLSLQKNGGEEICAEDIISVLGLSSMEQRAGFLNSCFSGNIASVIEILRDCESKGISVKSFIQDVLKMNTDVLLHRSGAQVVGTSYYLGEVEKLSAYSEWDIIRANSMLSSMASVPANQLSMERIVAEILSVMKKQPVIQEVRTPEVPSVQICREEDKQKEENVISVPAMPSGMPVVPVIQPEDTLKVPEENDGFKDIDDDTEVPFEGSYVAGSKEDPAVKESDSKEQEEGASFIPFGFGLFGGPVFGSAPAEKREAKEEVHASIPEESWSAFDGFMQGMGAVEEALPDEDGRENGCPEEKGGAQVTESEEPNFKDSVPEHTEGRIPWDDAAKQGLVRGKEEISLPVPGTPEDYEQYAEEAAEKRLEKIRELSEKEEADNDKHKDNVSEDASDQTDAARQGLEKLQAKTAFRIIYKKGRMVETENGIELYFKNAAHVKAVEDMIRKEDVKFITVLKE